MEPQWNPAQYANQGFIPGNLPSPAPAGAISGSPGDLQAGYSSAYNSAAGINAANYQNILGGYQGVAAGQRSAQDAIASGYSQLGSRIQGQLGDAAQQQAAGYGRVGGQVADYLGAHGGWVGQGLEDTYDRHRGIGGQYDSLHNEVMSGIQGIGREQGQQIQDQYARATGATGQQMVSRGLGNTTIQQTAQRGNEFDRSRAQNDLSERLAGLRAGYQSQLGQAREGFEERFSGVELGQQNLISGSLAQAAGQYGQANLQAQLGLAQQSAGYGAAIGQAGLNYANQANMQNTGLAENQLGWMNSVNAPYPNAAVYGQLAQQSGAAQAMRDAQGRLGSSQFAAGGGGGGGMSPGTGRGVPSVPGSAPSGVAGYGGGSFGTGGGMPLGVPTGARQAALQYGGGPMSGYASPTPGAITAPPDYESADIYGGNAADPYGPPSSASEYFGGGDFGGSGQYQYQPQPDMGGYEGTA